MEDDRVVKGGVKKSKRVNDFFLSDLNKPILPMRVNVLILICKAAV